MAGARAAIGAGRFADYVAETKEQWAARTRFSRGRAPNPKENPPAAEYAGPAGYSARWVLTQTNQRHATHATNITFALLNAQSPSWFRCRDTDGRIGCASPILLDATLHPDLALYRSNFARSLWRRYDAFMKLPWPFRLKIRFKTSA